jgi:hypothetical protein
LRYEHFIAVENDLFVSTGNVDPSPRPMNLVFWRAVAVGEVSVPGQTWARITFGAYGAVRGAIPHDCLDTTGAPDVKNVGLGARIAPWQEVPTFSFPKQPNSVDSDRK